MGDYYRRSETQDYGQDYGSSRGYSSARDYAAADQDRGGRGQGRGQERGGYGWQGREGYRGGERGQGGGEADRYEGEHTHDFTERGYGATGRYQGGRDERGRQDYGRQDGDRQGGAGRRDYGAAPQGYRYQDRGFAQRAGDEVRSWFGDEEAERRRDEDARHDERGEARDQGRHGRDFGRDHDDYHRWRQGQVDAFDRDYQEYRDENRSRFHQEFATWRTERQGQRDSLGRVTEHMEVVGSDGAHVGTVDKVKGDRILLTKNDADAGGQHHTIPSRWVTSVDTKVTLRHTAAEAKQRWETEQHSQALFGDKSDSRGGTGQEGRTDLNRSFSGTY